MGLLRGPFSSPIIPQRAAIDGLNMSAEEPSNGIPLRKFGRHKVKVSALGFGGHHLGGAENVQVAIRLVQEAVDNGITFFDNCWEYHLGKSEDWMEKGLTTVRSGANSITIHSRKIACIAGMSGVTALHLLDHHFE